LIRFQNAFPFIFQYLRAFSMAVYTEISTSEAGELLRQLGLGQLTKLEGCSGGIENTNYFATSDVSEHVLTVFERLSFEQLPYYLHLMKHLAAKGIPVPNPAPDAVGNILHSLQGKPACVVNKLRGKSELAPTPAHCAQVGEMLARMHLAGKDYERMQPNLRGLPWWNETVPVVLPFLTDAQRDLIVSELAYQNHIAAGSAYAALPRGPIHADLFRDNVMFEDGKLTGFFDFYFAGNDSWLFDLAVSLNDWCTIHGNKAAALRFWISRLWDFYLPREASMLKAHDPVHFERVLQQRVWHPYQLS
jgi:homoserine kinase type II